ncbi:hypothetical protein [Lactobacillus phage phiadh]|uniref:hypothetical protein n=1 Tax=Lactobacillus phage phiadh TaxID=12417 RepID=UPI000009B9DE|nr:hypothetical protein phiadhp02 [Lactobacillus phage phiadh]AAA53567.1 orfB 5' of intG [Lactobacillus phage phiadh]CAB52480.1 hypothetical protein [Lactobacillus phage phiadh]
MTDPLSVTSALRVFFVYCKFSSCFFFASNSSFEIMPSSANFLNFLISSAGSALLSIFIVLALVCSCSAFSCALFIPD